ncbi:MAG: hypothetical protein HXY25_09970 [Alphaproteobacteria bacterium]|nr:hypothetical protein [Alphaproteobacteria bacterium]
MLLYNDCEIRTRSIFVRSTGTRLVWSWSLSRDIARMLALWLTVSAVWLVRRPLKLWRPVTIGFYPYRPRPWYLIWNVTTFLGVRATDDPRDCDLLYYFEDATRAETDLAELARAGRPVINLACTDIGKDRVTAVFEEVFGYTLSLDPTRHAGEAVAKSTRNGAHDGRIVTCPIPAPEPGLVYQRLVDNSVDGRVVRDIRVPIIGREIPFVYIKERPLATRFGNDNSRVSFHETAELLSRAETDRLLAFAARMNLDVGSLDVLRDRGSGRIYVVDVNKTCMGPPVMLPFRDKVRAINRLARTFEAYVDARAGRGGQEGTTP